LCGNEQKRFTPYQLSVLKWIKDVDNVGTNPVDILSSALYYRSLSLHILHISFFLLFFLRHSNFYVTRLTRHVTDPLFNSHLRQQLSVCPASCYVSLSKRPSRCYCSIHTDRIIIIIIIRHTVLSEHLLSIAVDIKLQLQCGWHYSATKDAIFISN